MFSAYLNTLVNCIILPGWRSIVGFDWLFDCYRMYTTVWLLQDVHDCLVCDEPVSWSITRDLATIHQICASHLTELTNMAQTQVSLCRITYTTNQDALFGWIMVESLNLYCNGRKSWNLRLLSPPMWRASWQIHFKSESAMSKICKVW